jgi:hypothetical protein
MSVKNFVRLGAFVGVMALAACGGGSEQSSSAPSNSTVVDQPSRSATPNVPGQPQRTDSPDVPTAPINIPPIFDKQGRDISQVRAEVEAEIRSACGNDDLCVTVAVGKGNNESFTQCQYDTSNPQSFFDQPQFTLPRKSTLTLLTGTQPCESTSEETTDESTTESTAPSTPGTPGPNSDVEPAP